MIAARLDRALLAAGVPMKVWGGRKVIVSSAMPRRERYRIGPLFASDARATRHAIAPRFFVDLYIVARQYTNPWFMIQSFRHRGLKRLFEHGDRSRLPPALVDRIVEILGMLDVATSVRDMDLPQFRLHRLSGDRSGQWAVTVRANWRIVFRFDDAPSEVDFVDYH